MLETEQGGSETRRHGALQHESVRMLQETELAREMAYFVVTE